MAMASPYLLLRLAADEIFQTLEPSSSAAATPTHTATTSSSCYDAFVPVFRPDPTPASPALSVSAADRVRSQFLSVERDLFHDALVAPRNDGLGFPEDDDDHDDDGADSSASIPWDCLQFDEESEPDLPLYPPAPADEFDWEEVAPAPAPGPAAEPEWEVLGATPPADADEGFVYTSHRDAHDLLVAGGEALFLTSKPPASTSAIHALPSAVVTINEHGEECAVCKDGVAAGERVKRMPCSHRYHEDCIVPWLQVRNSCPLCRFELPTDDPKYEAWKAGRGRGPAVPA